MTGEPGAKLPRGAMAPEDFALVAEIEAHDLKRNLRFVVVGKHFEGGSKAGVRDHIRSQLAAVLRLGPTLLRFAIHRQHQHGMVGGEIGGRVVAAITVFAYRHYHIRVGPNERRN